MTQQIIHNLHIVYWTMVAQEFIANFLEWLKDKFLVSLGMCGIVFRIRGPMKIFSLILAGLTEGSFSVKYADVEDSSLSS